MRNRGERRKQDIKKAVRKKKISDRHFGDSSYYDNLHQYSKNKIHCSCPMCRRKTNNKGYYGRPKDWKHSDLVKIERLEEQLTCPSSSED